MDNDVPELNISGAKSEDEDEDLVNTPSPEIRNETIFEEKDMQEILNDEPSKTDIAVTALGEETEFAVTALGDDGDNDTDKTPVERMEEKDIDSEIISPFEEYEPSAPGSGVKPKGVIISNSADKKKLQA